MDELIKMGRIAAIQKLAEHERAGTLVAYISKIAPEFVVNGEVQKFTILGDTRLRNS
jgi:hypothetical protein